MTNTHLIILVLILLLFPSCKTADVPRGTPPSNAKVVSKPVVIARGETFDGKGRTYIADKKRLGDGSQREGQKPLFELHAGGRLQNLRIGYPGADGVHVYLGRGRDHDSSGGLATIRNLHVDDVGEDAVTVKQGRGTLRIEKSSFKHASDKTVQLSDNAEVRVELTDTVFKDVQKALRSGNKARRQHFEMRGGKIERARYAVFLNQSKATARLTGVKLVDVQTPVVERKKGQVKIRK